MGNLQSARVRGGWVTYRVQESRVGNRVTYRVKGLGVGNLQNAGVRRKGHTHTYIHKHTTHRVVLQYARIHTGCQLTQFFLACTDNRLGVTEETWLQQWAGSPVTLTCDFTRLSITELYKGQNV